MKKTSWWKKIKQQTTAAGTYQPFFDDVIETLSDILERRDSAREQFENSGGHAIVKHTNKSGATNLEQNPALRVVNDLNRDALTYWRELGLTARAWKELTGAKIDAANQKEDALEQVLKELAG